MKALVGAFNQEKALVGAFSVIVQLHRLIVNSSSEHWVYGAGWMELQMKARLNEGSRIFYYHAEGPF